MLAGFRKEWRKFKQAPAGRRFVEQHERHAARQGPWLKPLVLFSLIFALAMGIVLLVVPGASIVCFAIAAFLLPVESRWVASAYDRIERSVRRGGEPAREVEEYPEIDETPRAAASLERVIAARQHPPSAPPAADPRVMWIEPVTPPQAPTAGTTRIWSSEVPVTAEPVRPRPRATTTSRPSKAVIVVPPPVTIRSPVDKRPPRAVRPTVPLHRRSHAE